MKRVVLITFLLIGFGFSNVQAQDDPGPGAVTVYSEGGENFTLYLNGDRKNGAPSARVVVASVSEVPVSFRIVFENGSIPEIKKNGIRQGTNCLYAVEKNKKSEYVLKMKGCTNDPVVSQEPVASQPVISEPVVVTDVAQLSAKYKDGVITINDGRTISVKKEKANGMTYPRVMMTALQGAKVSIKYDDNNETYSAESPLEYEVKDFQNNNAYFTLSVDEGGPTRTWSVKLQNANGYDLKIE